MYIVTVVSPRYETSRHVKDLSRIERLKLTTDVELKLSVSIESPVSFLTSTSIRSRSY